MADLLPCPHCGGKEHEIGNGDAGYTITCHSFACRASTGAWATEAEAVAAWNRRSSPSPTGGEAGADVVIKSGQKLTKEYRSSMDGEVLHLWMEVSPELCEECGKFVAPQDAIWTDDGSPHHQTCLPAAPLMDEVEAVLRALLARDERNTCQHEETHRGGFLWEICDQCGAKWADDQGGKPEWSDPPEWVTARALLTKLQEGE